MALIIAEAVPLRQTHTVQLAGGTLRVDALTGTDQAVIGAAVD